MARKTGNKKGGIEVYKQDDIRRNAVPVGLASYDTSKLKPKKYEYDPHLDPQLVWAGKAEHTSFEVPTVSLHIHERIASSVRGNYPLSQKGRPPEETICKAGDAVEESG